MPLFILSSVVFCLFLIIEWNKNQSLKRVNRNVPLYQLLLSVLFTVFSGAGIWVASQREIAGVLKTQEFQQKQIDELKSSGSEMKASVRAIEMGVSEMRGDIKVIVSKMQ